MSEHSDLIRHEWSGLDGGDCVVLIHGSLDRSAGMARLARVLNRHCRVLRYDRRGYAGSWPHPGPFAIPDQVEDLRRLVGDRKVVLVGHSFGGNVALAASVTLPAEQVVGVSVFETPLSWMPWWPSDTAGAQGVKADPQDAAEAFMRRLIGDRGWQALPERTRNERRREGIALQSELSWIRNHEPWQVGDLHRPVICGRGSKGMEHHAKGMRWLARQTGGTCVEIEGAGHGAPNSHPLEFAELLVQPHVGW